MHITTFEETLGKKLLSLRKQRRFTQERLAEELQVSRQLVSSWEQDKTVPCKEKMADLCRLYGVPEMELIGGEMQTEVHTPLETVKSCVEKWEQSDEMRRKSVQVALAAVVGASITTPVLGIILCIGIFFVSRKWKVNHIWLDLLILVCLLVNVYFTFVILNYMIFNLAAMICF